MQALTHSLISVPTQSKSPPTSLFLLAMAASGLILNPSSLQSSSAASSTQSLGLQHLKKTPSFNAVKHYSSLEAANHSLRFKSSEVAIGELLCQARAGLEEGHAPRLALEGSGGVYFLSDEWGLENAAVFKPTDEEPLARNNPRGFVALSSSTSVEGLKRGTRVGEGAVHEAAAYLLDQAGTSGSGFAGVPPTVMVRCYSEAFSYGPQNLAFRRPKIGSLQRFVHSLSSCEDMGPSNFPVQEVHKITVLDLRLANTDRNGGNILVCQGEDGWGSLKLVPIDHGYCLPDKLEDCTFEWMNWPQAQQPYNPSTLSYITALDAHRDIKLLKQCGWNLRTSTARVLHASTMLLKKGGAAGLSPFKIGCMMSRYHSADTPSPLEEMMEDATTRSHDEDDLLRVLSHSMDLYIAKLQHS